MTLALQLAVFLLVMGVGGLSVYTYQQNRELEKSKLDLAETNAELRQVMKANEVLNETLAKNASKYEALLRQLTVAEKGLPVEDIAEIYATIEEAASDLRQVEVAEGMYSASSYMLASPSWSRERRREAARIHADISGLLESHGVRVRLSWPVSERGTWMALESTVLYYHEDTKEKAQAIADGLSRLVGEPFRISRGLGRGVPDGEEKWTLFVHYIPTEAL